MGNSQSEELMKGLNSQQKLAWQNLKLANQKLTKELQDLSEAKNILQAKNDELTEESVDFSTQLFEAETKLWVLSSYNLLHNVF